jgi:hypothetical protein
MQRHMQGWDKGYASRAAARGANLQVALRHRLNNRKYSAGTRETASPKIIRNLGTRPQIRQCYPSQKKKKVEEYQLKGRQIIAVPWGTRFLTFRGRRYVLGLPGLICISIIYTYKRMYVYASAVGNASLTVFMVWPLACL